MSKYWPRLVGTIVLLGTSIFIGTGCERIKNSMPWEKMDQKMETYAEARYRKAMRYMEESRFELAREQFAIVAATTTTPELKKLGLDGYVKAETAIAVKR
jgi:hypothetical protein